MEKIVKTDFSLTMTHIKKITVGDGECTINVDTQEYGNIDIYFEQIWDCRYCIENGGIVRWANLQRSEGLKGSFFEVENSDYLKYFEEQVEGTMPVDVLTDYLMSDEIDTIFEVLAFRKPQIKNQTI